MKAYQSCSFLFALKSIFEIIFEFDLVQSSNKFKPYLKMNLENQIRKRKEERKLSLPLPSIRPSSVAGGLLSLLLSLTSFSHMGLLLPAQFSFPLSLLLAPAQAFSLPSLGQRLSLGPLPSPQSWPSLATWTPVARLLSPLICLTS